MLGTIRHRFAQYVSRIDVPSSSSINKWLGIPLTFSSFFDIPAGLASENIYLQIADSIIDTTILAKQDDKIISLLIERLGKEAQIEVLSPSEIVEELQQIRSSVSVDLLPLTPSIACLGSKLTNLPMVFKPKVAP